MSALQDVPDAALEPSSDPMEAQEQAQSRTSSDDSAQQASEPPDQARAALMPPPPDLRRASSSGLMAARSAPLSVGVGRSRSRSGGDAERSSELVLQLQRLCRRQRMRSEERSFVRDVERVLTLLRGPTSSLEEALGSVQEETEQDVAAGVNFSSDRLQSARAAPTLAEIDALLDCIADLFEHRNPGVRALGFEVVQLCLVRFGDRMTPALRRKVFLRLETHPPGDFLLRQKALRALTQDGRLVEPFHVELGWLLLNLLEESDAQHDLLGLIQSIFRRSPHALDRDKVIAIVSVISARCDIAWGRGDLEGCRRFVAFFHVLAAHDLAYAASIPVCMRSLCCLVNADGHGTWSVMKLLLSGGSGFLVLRGLLQILEHPMSASSPWVLRGAVFFVGMSCWGSQRVAKFDEIAWAPILLALEQAIDCCRGVVIFEVILSLQRLIKKFGALNLLAPSGQNSQGTGSSAIKLVSPGVGHNTTASGDDSSSGPSSTRERRLVMEWEVILRMLRTLRPWVSMTDEHEIEDGPTTFDNRRSDIPKLHRTAAIHPANEGPSPQHQQQLSVSIQQTRIPRELLDTLQVVEDLVEHRQFGGDVDEFLDVLQEYLPHLSETSMLFLLRQRAEAAHPGYHLDWLATLSATMRTFFSCRNAEGDDLPVSSAVRLEALEVLRVNLWTSRNVCEDRVIEEVVIPTLDRVYEDSDVEVRRRSLGFIIEVARQLESQKFDALLDILANAMTLSSYEDAQVTAASGIVSLFSSVFDHLPPVRAVRMYDLLATTIETHRSRAVRQVALSCMLYVCEARATDGKLQWKEQQVRTSRFLFVSRRAARTNTTGLQLTAACVPVARALRALLTLVSSEPNAELFCMAVKGIKAMLENRAILEDVDVSEVSTKVVASIDYRAFGRAAIADEVDKLLKSQVNERSSSGSSEDTLVSRGSRSNTLTSSELVRSMHASTRVADPDNKGETTQVAFNTSLQATAALLTKTRFLAMGVELLQLLLSYEDELNDNAMREVSRCLIGTMELKLTVAEKDLFAGGATTEDASPPSSSASQGMLYGHEGGGLDSTDPYASGTPLNFTSRVLSRFQTSASHGSLFQALSSSVSKSTLGSSTNPTLSRRPSRSDRARLQEVLLQLYSLEFKLLHTTTTALSLMALLAPESVLDQLDGILKCSRGCVTTVDGDFRPDAFIAVLEMLSVVSPLLSRTQAGKAFAARKSIVEALLLGFEYAKSRQLAYLAFRLLCQVIHQSNRHDRIALADLAMPTLQQCTRRGNSLLAEAAVDFLLCFAYSQSSLIPSALGSRARNVEDDEGSETQSIDTSGQSIQVRSKSWVYKQSLLTITTTSRGNGLLVNRRANCTNRWKLDACTDLSLDTELFVSCLRSCDDDSDGRTLLKRHTISLPLDHEGGICDENRLTSKRLSLPAELRPSYPSHSSSDLSRSMQLPGHVTRVESKPARQLADQANTAQESRGIAFHMSPATALAPLPAYDGIGGSPSYYCESPQVRQPLQRGRGSRRSATQEKGDQVHEYSSGKMTAVHAIFEDKEEHDEDLAGEDKEQGFTKDESIMEDFCLDDSANKATFVPTVVPRVASFEGHTSASTSAPGVDVSTEESAPTSRHSQLDPVYLMMQLFDITTENRPQLLSDGPSLKLALSVLDRTPEYETHKIGLLYVRDASQSSESSILGNTGGSLRYLRFLRGLGTFTKLEGLFGYSGGLDTASNTDGKFGLLYKEPCAQVMFHVATMMVPDNKQPVGGVSSGNFASMKKKRHIGNDFVHVVYKECDEDYDLQTMSGQFNDVHIIIQALNDLEYRTEVHVKPGIPPFGPLYGRQIISSSIISESVRLTCLNANLACQVFHQDLVGFALNCEERLKQIKQLGLRLATSDEWKLDD